MSAKALPPDDSPVKAASSRPPQRERNTITLRRHALSWQRDTCRFATVIHHPKLCNGKLSPNKRNRHGEKDKGKEITQEARHHAPTYGPPSSSAATCPEGRPNLHLQLRRPTWLPTTAPLSLDPLRPPLSAISSPAMALPDHGAQELAQERGPSLGEIHRLHMGLRALFHRCGLRHPTRIHGEGLPHATRVVLSHAHAEEGRRG